MAPGRQVLQGPIAQSLSFAQPVALPPVPPEELAELAVALPPIPPEELAELAVALPPMPPAPVEVAPVPVLDPPPVVAPPVPVVAPNVASTTWFAHAATTSGRSAKESRGRFTVRPG